MKNKATHQGTCQICGSTQKLPSNLLSIHGYTVQWGFFSGVCSGSKNLPFEKSIALIEGAIANAQRMLDETRKESAELKNGKQFDNNQAMRSVYHNPTYANRGGYAWELVTIIATTTTAYDGKPFTSYTYKEAGADSKEQRLEIYKYPRPSFDELRTDMNTAYAVQHLDKRASNLASYIKWQHERIANWKPSELKPIERSGE